MDISYATWGPIWPSSSILDRYCGPQVAIYIIEYIDIGNFGPNVAKKYGPKVAKLEGS